MTSRDLRRAIGKKAGSGPRSPITDNAAALCEIGTRHLRAKRNLDAMVCCKRALAIDPNYADALHLMGLLSLEANEHDHAVEWISHAIRQSPKAEYLSSLGTALLRLGRYDDALKAVDKAVQLKPDDAALWAKLGIVLEEAKRPSEAVLCFQHVLKFDPRNLEAAYRGAPLLHQLGRPEEALAHFNLCNELRPNHPHTLGMRSLVLRDLKQFEEYLSDARQAHALAPESAELCNNVGDALLLLRRFEESLEWFNRALKFRPLFISALENKATVLSRMHRFPELFATFDQIRSIDPTNAKAELGIAHTHLLLGNFQAGWSGREARWRVPGLPIVFPDVAERVWLGDENIEGKTIIVYSDEGLGDAIQFARYVPMLASRGAHVILVVQDALRLLLSNLPGLTHCLPLSAASLQPADFRCAIMSLPLAFRTTLATIPPPIRLSPTVDKLKVWEQRLGPRNRLRVGLVWSGSLTHPNDFGRSIPLQALASILDVHATFFSLQHDPRPDDKTVLLERADIVDLTAHLTDFSETAALVSCLDLVITVDTSTAHLAGTLGCPTWIMLPHTPDYRWLLGRDDSPWYPTARLFRQGTAGGYEEVIQRVRSELANLVLCSDGIC
jgi:tetratricopeptide (TPR) repeat protein